MKCKTEFDRANDALAEKIKLFEEEYRIKHMPTSIEEREKQGWVGDIDGLWYHKKMRLAYSRKFRTEIQEVFSIGLKASRGEKQGAKE